MAIDESPGPPCWSTRHQLAPPPMAAAFARRTNRPNSHWRPYCQPCVDHLAHADAHYIVAYLDPTRQRRSQPDRPAHLDALYNAVHGALYPYHPDPAP